MAEVNAEDTIVLLKKARSAAQAIKDEIVRRNRLGGDPDDAARRRPILLRAMSLIEDADEEIDDLESSLVTVEVDTPVLDRIVTLADDLDRQIARNAIVNLGLDSLTEALNGVSEIKDALA